MRYLFFAGLFILVSCKTKSDELSIVLEDIVENELGSELEADKENYIFFLQNAACKCSDSTLENIYDSSMDATKNVIVVVNSKDHFSLPKLKESNGKVMFLSVNDLISYGFMQDKDVLVSFNKGKLIYENL